MDFLSTVVAAVIPSCIDPISENIAYPFKVSDNVKALDSATNKLVVTEADVKNRVQNAELQGLTQTNRVGQWLDQVEVVKKRVDEIRKRYEDISWCLWRKSFNWWSNYWISKDAAKELKAVEDLCQTGQFEEVATELPPRVQEFPIGSKVVPKEQADLQKILGYIDNDHDDIIGIWGMGGVGKTRLLHLVHNSYIRSSAFELVIFVTASRECSVEKIQNELCMKYRFGRKNSVEEQAKLISEYLCEKKFLLLLDDLWDRIDLQRVGIPHPPGRVDDFKRKVVITTRSERVCGLMDVKQSHKVAPLDFDDAWRLFVEKVGEETISSHRRLRSLARDVVKELAGLPLALVLTSRAMHGKKDPKEWDDAIDLLQRSRLHEIESTTDEEKTYNRLKFSYDSLETKELKDCFLACSLWPEDYWIEKADLIECWMGLGILHTSDARNIYNPGYTLIGKLLSACLLEHAGSDSVKMHDIIRDMVLWLACDFGKQRDKWIVRSGAEVNQVVHEKDRWRDTERATLLLPIDRGIDKPKSFPHEATKLHFLKVNDNINYSDPPVHLDALVQNLKFFTALTFLDLSGYNLGCFPPDILKLVNLRYLNLSQCNISSVPEDLKLLGNLRYLFLQNNAIDSFPKGVISQLRELQILNLYRTTFGSNKEYFTWLIEELGCLDKLKSLGIQLQHPTHLQSFLKLPYLPIRFLRIQYFDEIDSLVIPSSFVANRTIQDNLFELSIGGRLVKKVVIENSSQNSPCKLKNLEGLIFLVMPALEEIIWSRVNPVDLFLNLRNISISMCNKLNDVSWIVYLPCLEKLVLHSCDNMVAIISQSGLTSRTNEIREEMVTPTFPSLMELELLDVPNLQVICDPSITFPSLKSLHIFHCPMLKKLPFRLETVPGNLIRIGADRDWWEQLEWEENDHKTALQRYLC